MANVSLTKTVSASSKDFYSVITDYENYPQFVSEIKSAEIVSKKPKQAQFTLELVKTFQYKLEFKEKLPTEVSWRLLDSNLFKKNTGRWKLKEKNGILEVTYSLDVEFGFLVPSLIVNSMVKKDLPKMIERFENRVKELHG